jgi:hypothetical protein
MVPTIGSESPWGEIEDIERLADGLLNIHTSEHRALLPDDVLAATCGGLGREGWFERDVDVAIVAGWLGHLFPDVFAPAAIREAHEWVREVYRLEPPDAPAGRVPGRA